METTNINIRTSSELKAQAQEVFASLGLDMSTAINIFLKQVVYRDAIPFEISRPKNHSEKQARSSIRGCLKGKVWMASDFDAPIDDMKEYMQ